MEKQAACAAYASGSWKLFLDWNNIANDETKALQ